MRKLMDSHGNISRHFAILHENAELLKENLLMVKRTADSEFLYHKPQITNSKRDWLNHRGKKTEVLIFSVFFQHVR